MATEGHRVIEFIETFLQLGGSFSGERFILRDWQRDLVCDLYELNDDGTRRYRAGLIGLPRKNGKSQLGAALALYHLVADGEPNAQVFSVAGARDQARLVFDQARRMVTSSPELRRFVRSYQHHLEVPETHSAYRVLSSDANTAQGLEPHCVIFDEVHVQPSGDLWEAMTLGSGTRRQPLILGITTAGFERDSLCYRLYDYGKRVESGEVEDRSFFFRWWEPSNADMDPYDEAAWAESNPALGDFKSLEDMRDAAKRQPESAFRRFYLNQWTTTASAWLPHGVWDTCAKPDRHLEPGERVVLGFDGAWRGDSTALVACAVDDFHLEVLGHWECPPDDPHYRVPVAEVEQAVRDACRRFHPAEVVCDPWRWEQSLAHLADEGYPIVEYPTNSIARMGPATQAFYEAAMESRLSHTGDPRLARHVANCVLKEDARGARITKEAKGSARKIDLAVAAVIAHHRATLLRDEKLPELRIIGL